MRHILQFALLFLLTLPAWGQTGQTTANLNLAQTFTQQNTFSATNALILSAMTGTSCLEEVSGVITPTGTICGGGSLSGLTTGQVIIAASPTTATSSMPLAGGGSDVVAATITSLGAGQTLVANSSSILVNATPGVPVDTTNTATIPVTDNVSFLAPSTITTLSGVNTLTNGFTFGGCNLNTSSITYTPASGLIYPGGGSTANIPPSWCFYTYTNGSSTYMAVLPTYQTFAGVLDTTVTVGSGTQSANSCSSASTVTMTGLTTSMVILPGYSSTPSALIGWGSSGGMVFQAWPSAANTLAYILCNQTSSSITYSAITFNVGAR
jgi:hypothetical protein